MTERERAFRRARAAAVRQGAAANRETLRTVQRVLEQARVRVAADLAATASDFQAWQLPRILRSIEATLAETGEALAAAGNAGAAAAHRLGVALVDAPLAEAGIRIAGALPAVDQRQLAAIRSFMTDRLRDVTSQAVAKVNAQIGLAIAGAQPPSAAIAGVQAAIGGSRGRALTIVRTEMGRAFSVAAQERMDLAAEVVPGLKKQWRRSGKLHSRVSHDLADGQVVDVDKPFDIGGVELMYPRDPAAPASETINCGCVSLPFVERWEVAQPGRQPFSDDEQRRNRRKRDLEMALGG